MFVLIGVFQILAVITFIFFLLKTNANSILIIPKIILFSTLIAFFKYLIIFYLFNPGYPNSTFLFRPDDRFNDFVNMIITCKDLDPYNFSNYLPSVYFPVANLFYFGFYAICNFNLNLSIIVYIVSFLILSFILIDKFLEDDSKIKGYIFCAILFSYPILFSLDRLNLEMVLFLFLGGFIYSFKEGKNMLAVILLSLAICMKLYPILFLILFLKNKNYKAIFGSFLACILFSVFSLILFKGGGILNIQKLYFNINNFNQIYSGPAGIQHNLSIYGVIKIFLFSFLKFILKFSNHLIISSTNQMLSVPYLIFVFFYFSLISLYIFFIEKTLWKLVFLVTSLFVLLPYVSFDYKLLHLIVPMLLFLQNFSKEKFAVIYSVLFALIMIPNSYFYIIWDVSIGVLINPFIIIVISVFIILENKYIILNKLLLVNHFLIKVFK